MQVRPELHSVCRIQRRNTWELTAGLDSSTGKHVNQVAEERYSCQLMSVQVRPELHSVCRIQRRNTWELTAGLDSSTGKHVNQVAEERYSCQLVCAGPTWTSLCVQNTEAEHMRIDCWFRLKHGKACQPGSRRKVQLPACLCRSDLNFTLCAEYWGGTHENWLLV